MSPLSGAVRTLSTLGARWRFVSTWASLEGTDRHVMEAFLGALNGRAGRFYFSPPEWVVPKGTARTGVVNGGSQTGSVLNVTLVAGATFKAGDFFEVNNELKRITANVTADGAGAASLAFTPPLRASPTGGASLVLTAPRAAFMLIDDEVGVTVTTGGRADVTIDAIEAFP